MNISLNGHDESYSVYTMVKSFFPFDDLDVKSSLKFTKHTAVAFTQITAEGKSTHAEARKNLSQLSLDKAEYKRQITNLIKRSVYQASKKFTGRGLKWGILTGIRPAKLARELSETKTLEECNNILTREYLVSMSKIGMLWDVLKIEQTVISSIDCKDVSLYISIPFCPTRCSYCSFVSHSIQKAGHLIDDYLEVLSSELESLSGIIKEKNLNLKCIYIGGGTPTVLDENKLFMLLSAVDNNFDMTNVLEYTLEAGRADTITRQKLEIAKNFGVNRISINPQTMNDEILKALGRNHTSQDVVNSYYAAKEIGFDNINMDIIAGLPGDNLENYKHTIDRVISLDPQSITVHTLSMKKGSKIGQGNESLKEQYFLVSDMLKYSSQKLSRHGFLPYYLYRQKSQLGNMENAGYSKPSFECIYNIYIMEEVMSILAVGAGGVSKILMEGNKIDRVFNYKYPYEYISDKDKILKNHQKLCSMLPQNKN